MVHIVKADGDIFGVPAGTLDAAMKSYASGAGYRGLKDALLGEKLSEADFPVARAARDMGYLDFDAMEEHKLDEPVPVGLYTEIVARKAAARQQQ